MRNHALHICMLDPVQKYSQPECVLVSVWLAAWFGLFQSGEHSVKLRWVS